MPAAISVIHSRLGFPELPWVEHGGHTFLSNHTVNKSMLTGPARPHTAEIQLSANAGSILKHRWVGSCSNWTCLLSVSEYSSVISSLNVMIHRFGCYPMTIFSFSLSHLLELEAPPTSLLFVPSNRLMDAGHGNHTAVAIKFQYSHSTNVSWSLDTKGHSPSLLQWSPCLLSTCNLCLADKAWFWLEALETLLKFTEQYALSKRNLPLSNLQR